MSGKEDDAGAGAGAGAGDGEGGHGAAGILKASPETRKRKGGGIQWDEQTIAEHDKERGTRMKIDEPKTPYHLHHGEGGKEGEPDALDLAGSAQKAPKSPSSDAGGSGGGIEAGALKDKLVGGERGEWDTSSDEGAGDGGDDADEAAKHAAFEARRKMHYDEARKMKEWKAKLAAGIDDDDDDDEDGGGDEGESGGGDGGAV